MYAIDVQTYLCNQQVGGSSPSTSFNLPQRSKLNMGEFPSGQRGQTVNLLSVTSVVRIHLPPPIPNTKVFGIFVYSQKKRHISNGKVLNPNG